jgi:hypothetical protein
MGDFNIKGFHVGGYSVEETLSRAHTFVSTRIIEPCTKKHVILKVVVVALALLAMLKFRITIQCLAFVWKAVVLLGKACVAAAPHVASAAATAASSVGTIGASCAAVAASVAGLVFKMVPQKAATAQPRQTPQPSPVVIDMVEEELRRAWPSGDPAPTTPQGLSPSDSEFEIIYNTESASPSQSPSPTRPFVADSSPRDPELEKIYKEASSPFQPPQSPPVLMRQGNPLYQAPVARGGLQQTVSVEEIGERIFAEDSKATPRELLGLMIAKAKEEAAECDASATGIRFVARKEGLEIDLAVQKTGEDEMLFAQKPLSKKQQVELLKYLRTNGFVLKREELPDGVAFTLSLNESNLALLADKKRPQSHL